MVQFLGEIVNIKTLRGWYERIKEICELSVNNVRNKKGD